MTPVCGVCGVVAGSTLSEEDVALVDRMNAAQRHRGPDDTTQWAEGPGALGHTRLAIIDLSDGGRQPFAQEGREGPVNIVFNGEIYNHEELRSEFKLTNIARCDG